MEDCALFALSKKFEQETVCFSKSWLSPSIKHDVRTRSSRKAFEKDPKEDKFMSVGQQEKKLLK